MNRLRAWLQVMLLLLVSLDAAAEARTPSAQAYRDGLGAWARVLKTFVDDAGRTDFRRLAGARADLDAFVQSIADYGPATDPAAFTTPTQVLAYHINAYNALAMQGVIEKGIPDGFDSFFKRAGFFRFRGVTVNGSDTNLYDYENKVIRPLGEPRVHFALNCMVRDCPRLPREPFDGDTLEATLERLTFEFFSKPLHFRRDDGKRTVWVSEILDFYTEDFVPSGKARDLPRYINKYLEAPIPPDWKVRFIDYNWAINQSP